LFSCLDLSNENLKSFKTFLEKRNIRLIFIKKSLLKKILEPLPGFHNIKGLLNGSILIGVPMVSQDIYEFTLSLEKKHKAVILGAFLNQVLYSNSFVNKLSKLNSKDIYSSLISVCLQKQLTLTSLLSIHTKKL
jgi:ribosomal protein L10